MKKSLKTGVRYPTRISAESGSEQSGSDCQRIWYIDVTGEDLVISIRPSTYHQKKSRGAGRHRTYAKNVQGICHYSDIVYMMQSMRDQDIASEIGMAIATYRRHKKVMKESAYYHTLDLNRLNDKDYLDQHEGNYSF